jgi:hypothetical protein
LADAGELFIVRVTPVVFHPERPGGARFRIPKMPRKKVWGGLFMVGILASGIFTALGALDTSRIAWAFILGVCLVGLILVLGWHPDFGFISKGRSEEDSMFAGLRITTAGVVSKPVGIAESDVLLITIDKEEWHPFDHKALILGVRITVVNKTDQEHALMGVQLHGIDPWRISMHDIDVDRERYRWKESRPQFHGTSPPGETTIGWVWMAFDQRLREGRPGYELTIRDGVDNQYRFPVAARPGETFGSEL